MPLIKRSCIDEIKGRVNIYDVVTPYVNLKKTGANWRGLSPFNPEKTPSFYVLPEKNIFKCFSSGHAGDVFRFVELVENLNFQEAVESIASRFGINLDYEEGASGQTRNERSLKRNLEDIHDIAANYFHQCFMAEHPDAEAMRNYWTNDRGFSLDTAKTYKVGFAPAGKQSLLEQLLKQKFPNEAIRECGLFYLNENEAPTPNTRPRFRGRLMIPIRNLQGQVVAFTARQTQLTPANDPAREAKYVNSPQTPIFNKSNILFGLDHARKHFQEDSALTLVEGQLDTLRFWEKGHALAVAPQGTSITQQQMELIRRYTSKLDCLFDGDDAGQKAALRLMPMAFQAGIEPRFIRLPEGQDPDGLIAKEGLEAIEDLRKKALSPMAFVSKIMLPQAAQASPREKANALHRIFTLLMEIDSQVVQLDYLQELSHLFRVNWDALKADFDKNKLQKARFGTRRAPKAETIEPTANSPQTLTKPEFELLFIALHHEQLLPNIAQGVNIEWVNQKSMDGQLLRRVLAEYREGLWEGSASLESVISNEQERNYIYSLLAEEPRFEEPEKVIHADMQALFMRHCKDQIRDLEQKMLNTSPDDSETLESLQTQRIELRKQIQNPPVLTFH